MKEKLEKARQNYLKELINIYGEDYGLSQDVLDTFYEVNSQIAGSVFVESAVKERLYYIVHPEATFHDYFLYEQSIRENN